MDKDESYCPSETVSVETPSITWTRSQNTLKAFSRYRRSIGEPVSRLTPKIVTPEYEQMILMENLSQEYMPVANPYEYYNMHRPSYVNSFVSVENSQSLQENSSLENVSPELGTNLLDCEGISSANKSPQDCSNGNLCSSPKIGMDAVEGNVTSSSKRSKMACCGEAVSQKSEFADTGPSIPVGRKRKKNMKAHERRRRRKAKSQRS
eukprot:TRINITY_DN25532_c0_g1_i1.p1 TRINITY_DN25532_c0_g1~~TRINITY_DN25532_c0_g1_i1.p1  ORF type:complete len:207 (+),score=20.15 TRINITY_DN25532_c0_g1_i1:488-1108(+)